MQFHVPMYCTNVGHYMEGEIFRRQYEPLLYKYGVDIVMNGHVHAYERSFPVYNNTVDPCGITHLVLGDGGNYENAYVPWIVPQKSWSAFREASFGVASLNVMSATQVPYRNLILHHCSALHCTALYDIIASRHCMNSTVHIRARVPVPPSHSNTVSHHNHNY